MDWRDRVPDGVWFAIAAVAFVVTVYVLRLFS